LYTLFVKSKQVLFEFAPETGLTNRRVLPRSL
jgi:hypothetical protein